MILVLFPSRFAYLRPIKETAGEAGNSGVAPQAPHLQPPKKAHWQVTQSLSKGAGEPWSEKDRIILCAPAAAPIDMLRKRPDTYPQRADCTCEAWHCLADIFTSHGLGNRQGASNVRRRGDKRAQRANWKRTSFFRFEHTGSRLRQCLIGKQPPSQSHGTCFILKTSRGPSQVIVSVGNQKKHDLHLLYLMALGRSSLSPSQPPSKQYCQGGSRCLCPSRRCFAFQKRPQADRHVTQSFLCGCLSMKALMDRRGGAKGPNEHARACKSNRSVQVKVVELHQSLTAQ